ncbi:metal ABC transporter solute-binding protein, Zn/Mn family [Mesobacillus subterraneus]|uniref:Adhesin n=1 Tax=Mesobacillus subterraneus TaxID=285983 RepID=A0A427TTU3_9BACI|nr:zinc ABC transporter substrate-binding protein [Mesobacillus subterraneus]RSD27854.1 adhesin [Mesobacillus subterraneus]
MKKNAFILFIFTIGILLSGCGQETAKETAKDTQDDNKLQIYTTVYPLQYFAQEIGGEFVNVETIYPPGADEHTFEPSQKDMIALADADLFFYVGLGLEGFVDKASKTLKNEKVKMVPTGEALDMEEHNEEAEGHEDANHGEGDHEDANHDSHDGEESHEEHEGDNHKDDASHEDEHGNEESHEDEHGNEESHEDEHGNEESHEDEHNHGDVDPHVWLNLVYADQLALVIKDQLVEIMPEQKETFEQNYANLSEQLRNLDTQFKETVDSSKRKEFIVSHSAFGYWEERYGVKQISIAGQSTTSEPSQKELQKLITHAKDEKIKYVLNEQNFNSKLAQMVQKEIGAELLTLHNLSVLTDEDLKNKETYLTLMENNIATLKKALNE